MEKKPLGDRLDPPPPLDQEGLRTFSSLTMRHGGSYIRDFTVFVESWTGAFLVQPHFRNM